MLYELVFQIFQLVHPYLLIILLALVEYLLFQEKFSKNSKYVLSNLPKDLTFSSKINI
jgi:hypothetical protein